MKIPRRALAIDADGQAIVPIMTDPVPRHMSVVDWGANNAPATSWKAVEVTKQAADVARSYLRDPPTDLFEATLTPERVSRFVDAAFKHWRTLLDYSTAPYERRASTVQLGAKLAAAAHGLGESAKSLVVVPSGADEIKTKALEAMRTGSIDSVMAVFDQIASSMEAAITSKTLTKPNAGFVTVKMQWRATDVDWTPPKTESITADGLKVEIYKDGKLFESRDFLYVKAGLTTSGLMQLMPSSLRGKPGIEFKITPSHEESYAYARSEAQHYAKTRVADLGKVGAPVTGPPAFFMKKAIDFKPPQEVADAAARGLEYRKKSGKGGLTNAEASDEGIGSGVQRAVDLKNRKNISPDTINRMLSFFARHEKNKDVSEENKNTPWNDAGHVAWLLWGGDPGLAWAKKIKSQMESQPSESKKMRVTYKLEYTTGGKSVFLPFQWRFTIGPDTSWKPHNFEIASGAWVATIFVDGKPTMQQQFPALSDSMAGEAARKVTSWAFDQFKKIPGMAKRLDSLGSMVPVEVKSMPHPYGSENVKRMAERWVVAKVGELSKKFSETTKKNTRFTHLSDGWLAEILNDAGEVVDSKKFVNPASASFRRGTNEGWSPQATIDGTVSTLRMARQWAEINHRRTA